MNTSPDQKPETVTQLPVPKPRLAAGGVVAAIIPDNLESVHRLATWIARAAWAPKTYRDAPPPNSPKGTLGEYSAERIAVGILHGLEVGFTPIAALQSIAVINGTPCIWGDGALALVLASGKCEDHIETPIYEERPTEKSPGVPGKPILMCVGYEVTFKRKGRATPITQRFDDRQARDAGLLGKDGPWQQYRKRMYQMRARAWAMRDGFSDVLRGLAIREEVEDYVDTTSTVVTRQSRPQTAHEALDQFATNGIDAPPPATGTEDDEPEQPPPPPPPPTPQPEPDEKPQQPPLPPEQPPGESGDLFPAPKMPELLLKQWTEQGSWMGAWRWLQMQLLECKVPEVAQALADEHVEVLRAVYKHNRQFRNAVTAVLEKSQAMVDLE